MDTFYMIVDASRASQWRDAKQLPKSYMDRPGVLHTDKEFAKRELLRLQRQKPNGKYVLLQAIAQAVEVKQFDLDVMDEVPF